MSGLKAGNVRLIQEHKHNRKARLFSQAAIFSNKGLANNGVVKGV